MKVADDPNLERRHQLPAAMKRRYEPPQLLTETMDVKGTNKSFTNVSDIHDTPSTNSGS